MLAVSGRGACGAEVRGPHEADLVGSPVRPGGDAGHTAPTGVPAKPASRGERGSPRSLLRGVQSRNPAPRERVRPGPPEVPTKLASWGTPPPGNWWRWVGWLLMTTDSQRRTVVERCRPGPCRPTAQASGVARACVHRASAGSRGRAPGGAVEMVVALTPAGGRAGLPRLRQPALASGAVSAPLACASCRSGWGSGTVPAAAAGRGRPGCGRRRAGRRQRPDVADGRADGGERGRIGSREGRAGGRAADARPGRPPSARPGRTGRRSPPASPGRGARTRKGARWRRHRRPRGAGPRPPPDPAGWGLGPLLGARARVWSGGSATPTGGLAGATRVPLAARGGPASVEAAEDGPRPGAAGPPSVGDGVRCGRAPERPRPASERER